jgi:hypothetical protein
MELRARCFNFANGFGDGISTSNVTLSWWGRDRVAERVEAFGLHTGSRRSDRWHQKPESSKPRGNTEALAAADISSPDEAFMPANGITLLYLEREHILDAQTMPRQSHSYGSVTRHSDRGLCIKLATYAKMGAGVPPPSPGQTLTFRSSRHHAMHIVRGFRR